MIQNVSYRTKASIRVGQPATLRYVAKAAVPAMILSCTALTWAASSSYDYQVIAKVGEVIGGVTLQNVEAPFVSDDGTVLFVGTYNSCCTALVSKRPTAAKGSILVRTGDSIGGVSINQINGAKRNDNGGVVFTAGYGQNLTGIFRPQSAVVVSGQTIGGITIGTLSASPFDLNDSGEIVFPGTWGNYPNGISGIDIFTPSRVIVQTDDVIGGLTLVNPYWTALSKNGVVAFSSGFLDSEGQRGFGVFTQHRLVFKQGGTIGGLTLARLSLPTISETGTVAFMGDTGPTSGFSLAVVAGGAIIAKTGDVIDGLTISGPLDSQATPSERVPVNANGEIIFQASATNSSGATVQGWFTQDHSVVAAGDTIAGLTVSRLGSFVGDGSINDAGQIAFVITTPVGQAVILATPNGN